jgi:hypothetical protein
MDVPENKPPSSTRLGVILRTDFLTSFHSPTPLWKSAKPPTHPTQPQHRSAGLMACWPRAAAGAVCHHCRFAIHFYAYPGHTVSSFLNISSVIMSQWEQAAGHFLYMLTSLALHAYQSTQSFERPWAKSCWFSPTALVVRAPCLGLRTHNLILRLLRSILTALSWRQGTSYALMTWPGAVLVLGVVSIRSRSQLSLHS